MNVDAYERKFAAHHAEAEAIGAHLRAIDQQGRAQRIESCGTFAAGFVCPDCGEFHVTTAHLCRDRLCPNCGWTLARKRCRDTSAALAKLQEQLPGRVSHMVLTLRHKDGDDLRGHLQTLTRGYGRLLRSPAFLSCTGSARSIEITHGTNGFHPHIHAIVHEPHGAESITPEIVQDEWSRAILSDGGYCDQVHFEPAYARDNDTGTDDAVFEAVKYALKPGTLLELGQDEFRHYADSVRGVRMTAASGLLRAYLARERAAANPWSKQGCDKCGSTEKQENMVLMWNYDTGSMMEGRPYQYRR